MWYDKWILFFKNKFTEIGNFIYDSRENPWLYIISIWIVYYASLIVVAYPSEDCKCMLIGGFFLTLLAAILTWSLIYFAIIPFIKWIHKNYKLASEGKAVKVKWKK